MNLSMILGFLVICGGQLVTAKTGFSVEVSLLPNNSNFTISNLTNLAGSYLYQNPRYVYVVRIYLGNPPKSYTLLVDSGSSVTWVEHALCLACINNDGTGYFEDDSSTAGIIYCEKSKDCTLPSSFCGRNNRRCQFRTRYLDTDCEGFYFLDTLYMDAVEERTYIMKNFTFGAALNVIGPFDEDMDGIFGLGNANGSFLSQQGFKRLSFCLQTYGSSQNTKLLLGDEARMLGESTPLINAMGLYAAVLEGITVGDEYLNIEDSQFRNANGMITGAFIDTGARITLLPTKAYKFVFNKLVSIINLPILNLEAVNIDRLCYMGGVKERDKYVPSMMLQFEGLTLLIPPRSLFMADNGIMCLDIQPDKSLTIIGSPFLQNVNVGIDIDQNKIYMDEMRCSMI